MKTQFLKTDKGGAIMVLSFLFFMDMFFLPMLRELLSATSNFAFHTFVGLLIILVLTNLVVIALILKRFLNNKKEVYYDE